MSALSILAQAKASWWLPPEASKIAPVVDSSFAFVFWISAFFFTLIVGLMVFFVIKYRHKKGVTPPTTEGHLGLELTWTGIPLLVVAAIFWEGFAPYMQERATPNNAYDITVHAHQWKWLFQYPNGWVDPVLHVPVDQPVHLTLESADVIHSLFIPAFRVKQDVVPGRLNQLNFTATKPGEYNLFCTQYCGLGHSSMHTIVKVHEIGGFEKWLKSTGDLLSPLLKSADMPATADGFWNLVDRILHGDRPIDHYVKSNLPSDVVKTLSGYKQGQQPTKEQIKSLADGLQKIQKSKTSIYTEERFEGVKLSDDTKKLMAKDAKKTKSKKKLTAEDVQLLNRYLLADAYPGVKRHIDFVGAGRQFYETIGCKQCHNIDGTANTGPTWKGIYGTMVTLSDGSKVKVDPNYIHESIRFPGKQVVKGFQPVMPQFGKDQLSDRQIDAIIAFIKSLGNQHRGKNGKKK